MNTTETNACVSFAVSKDMQAFIDAAQAVARDVDMDTASQRDSAASLDQAVQAVSSLHVDALLESLDTDGAAEEADAVLAHVAYTLATARPEAAWQGLLAALEKPLWQALGEPFATAQAGRIAWPVATPDGTARWVCWTAAATGSNSATAQAICLLQAEGERLAGPYTLADLQAGFDVQIESPVMGMPAGQALWIRARSGAQQPTDAGLPLKTPGAAATARRQHQVLLAAVLAGMTQRASLAAYAYAKTRQSGGKPIMHHQAVALRLADIAMNQQALWLYVQACGGGDKAGMAMSVSHIHELASRVTRDAVQVAGAHGFVEGLPFKRLFEQTRTVLTALRATAPAKADQSL